MDRFTNQELGDMHFVYGLCNGSSLAAAREYRRRFPLRRIPDRQVFVNIHRNLCENGSFRRARGQGRPQANHNWENVLNYFEEYPGTSNNSVTSHTYPRSIVIIKKKIPPT